MDGRGFGRTATIVFTSSGISFFMEIIHEAVRYYTGTPIMAIDWAANALMVATSLYIRGHVDKERFRHAVMESLQETRPISPMRFINGMPAAMVVGFVAEITIRYNFIAGMVLYLVMQVFLIYSFSGIISITLRDILGGQSGNYYTAVVVLWVLMPAAMFYLFIHEGLRTLVVIPYMVFLSLMAMMTYFAFASAKRPLMFRLAPVIASTLFVASDIMVGYMAFRNPVNNCYAAISMTYIAAMLLFNMTILFLKTGNGESVLS